MAFDAFLVLKNAPNSPASTNITSETQDARFASFPAIEVKEFSFGAENTSTLGSATGGAGSGKATFKSLTIMKSTSLNTPRLFAALATGSHYETATLYIRNATGHISNIFTFALVFVSSLTELGSEGDEFPTEQVTFVYAQANYSSYPLTGNASQGTSAGWNIVTNTNGGIPGSGGPGVF